MPRTRSLAWSELKIGVLMTVAVGIAGVLVFSLTGSRGFFWQRYTLKTRFAAVPGLTPGSPVRVAGVEVGTVRGIELGGEQVDITFEVNKSVRDRITDQLVASANDVTNAIKGGRGTLGRLVTDRQTVDALNASLRNLETMTQRINAGEGSLGKLLKDDAFSQSLTGATTNLRTLTDRLNRGEGTAGKLMTDPALFNRLNDVTTRLDQVVTKLNDGEGTAGQLLKDKQ